MRTIMKRRRRLGGGPIFTGGDVDFSSVLALSSAMVGAGDSPPVAGGLLSIAGEPLGSYDYAILRGDVTVASFSSASFFTATGDSRSAWVVVDGNMTINAGQTFQPSARKLFTVLHVKGDLTVNGTISMTSRGASHASIEPRPILVKAGVDIPAIGALGGAARSSANAGALNGFNGASGASGESGGGGSGRASGGSVSFFALSGAGAEGTAFSGGAGGGGAIANSAATADAIAADGAVRGGAGGFGAFSGGGSGGGGAGNPGGLGTTAGTAGSSGTGGTLIIICHGSITGSGAIVSEGAPGNVTTASCGGGGSGGGSIVVLSGGTTGITPTAAGGAGGANGGGAGGAGSVWVLAL